MKTKNLLLCLTISLLVILGCASNSRNVEVRYLKEGKICSEKIPLDFIKNGQISSPYIDTVKCSYLDSLSYPDMNPDHYETHTTPIVLDFSKKIEPYSPEYYCAYSVYNIIKVIENYNRLFDNKIDFNSQKDYKTIEITLGDGALFTSPNTYIFEKNSNPSPSLFAHEIGHRAFWYLEDSLKIKFKGLSVIHMGLLEYFTVSFNNSPVVGEDFLPHKLMRDVSKLYKYPIDSTFTLRNTFRLLEESYPEEIKNPQSYVSRYLAACYSSYSDSLLDNVYDNHRGAMVLTSTLWHIREQIGQEKTDKLVAQTILNLNIFLDKRAEFYQSSETPWKDKIGWYDVFYGLIQKDKELFEGKDIQVITNEFARTGYPIEIIKY